MKITKSDLKKMILDALDDTPQANPVKQTSDVERAGQKMDKIQGLDTLLSKINNRLELEQLLVQLLEKTNVKPGDIYTAFVKAAKAAQTKAKGS